MKRLGLVYRSVLIALWSILSCGSAKGIDREVFVTNERDGVRLAGTLTLPDESAPRAVIVMATGSGQQNRDEELLGHRPFKTIAEYLADRGYASLRMDDRGCGGSEGNFATSITPDFVEDIKAALAYVANELPGVPAGVLGHSQGGTVGIMTAAKDSLCSFLVTIGAPAVQGDSLIMSQCRALSTKMTGGWQGEQAQRKYLDIAMSDTPEVAAKLKLKISILKDLGDMARMPGVEAQVDRQIEGMLSPDYRWMLRYNPEQDVADVKGDWLAINGELDLQVLPDNLRVIKKLNSKADTLLLKGHNHLLQQCKTGLPAEYASISEDISDEALKAIGDWLDLHAKRSE